MLCPVAKSRRLRMLRQQEKQNPGGVPRKGEEAPGVFVSQCSAAEACVVTPISPALIERRVSVERLAPYCTATAGDLVRAVALYEWNAQTGAAFWATLDSVAEFVTRRGGFARLAGLS